MWKYWLEVAAKKKRKKKAWTTHDVSFFYSFCRTVLHAWHFFCFSLWQKSKCSKKLYFMIGLRRYCESFLYCDLWHCQVLKNEFEVFLVKKKITNSTHLNYGLQDSIIGWNHLKKRSEVIWFSENVVHQTKKGKFLIIKSVALSIKVIWQVSFWVHFRWFLVSRFFFFNFGNIIGSRPIQSKTCPWAVLPVDTNVVFWGLWILFRAGIRRMIPSSIFFLWTHFEED